MSFFKHPDDSATQYLEAIRRKDFDAISTLISAGIDIESKDRDGRTPLINAVVEGDVSIIRLLLNRGANVNTRDKQSWTPLHFAAHNYSEEIAILLLEHGAIVDAQDQNGNTPLFRAVFNSQGRGDLINLLRNHGANPSRKNNHDVSPQSLAKTIANFPVAKFFEDIQD